MKGSISTSARSSFSFFLNVSLVHVLKYTYILVQEGSFDLHININLFGGGLQVLHFIFRGAKKCLEYCATEEGLKGRETKFHNSQEAVR